MTVRSHGVLGDLSSYALVDCGRVEKTVAKDDFSFLDGGENHFPNQLSPARRKEQQFCLGEHGLAFFRMHEKMANVLADKCAAGFARYYHLAVIDVLQSIGDAANLGRLAASFGSLEGD